MRKQTDLAKVKQTARSLLFTDIHETEFSPVIVSHPFTDSGFVASPNANGEIGLLNITESDADQRRWREYMGKLIDGAKSAYEIYMITERIREEYGRTPKEFCEGFYGTDDIRNEHSQSNSARMQVRAEMQYVDKYSDYATWESVSPLMVKEIKVHITPLLDSGLEGFDLSIAFDIRMLDIELSMLVQGNTGMATRDVKTVRQVAQYLLTEKASIPQVFAKAEQLKTLVSEQFWDAPSLEKLEQLRVDVRDLMQFLDKR